MPGRLALSPGGAPALREGLAEELALGRGAEDALRAGWPPISYCTRGFGAELGVGEPFLRLHDTGGRSGRGGGIPAALQTQRASVALFVCTPFLRLVLAKV